MLELGYLFAEIVNSRDLDRFAELVSNDYINHNPQAAPGLAGVRQVFEAILTGIPDMIVTVEDVILSDKGDKLVGRYRYEGTHTGPFFGAPATGNHISMRSIDIWRVDGGRFVEHWDELNTLEVFMQAGAVEFTNPPAQE
jgi:steroid delta-isomerase-like uncharacterized protein